MEVLREEKQLHFFPWMHNNRKDVNLQFVGAQQLMERGRKIHVGEECVFPFHSEVNYGWSVHGGKD